MKSSFLSSRLAASDAARMSRVRRAAGLFVLLAGMGFSVWAGPDDDWARGLLECRGLLAGTGLQESGWYASVPMPAPNVEAPLAPEQGPVNLTAKGPDGAAVWRVRPELENGRVHDLGMPDATSLFLYRTVTVPADTDLPLSLGSDDSVSLHVNGKRVHLNPAARVAAPDQDRITVQLKKGENAILLRIHNISGGSGFYYSNGRSRLPQLVNLENANPEQTRLVRTYFPGLDGWLGGTSPAALDGALDAVAARFGVTAAARESREAVRNAAGDDADARRLVTFLALAREADAAARAVAQAAGWNLAALRRAITDLRDTFGARYPRGNEYLAALDRIEPDFDALRKRFEGGDAEAGKVLQDFNAAMRAALLDNPLLDFERILMVRRAESNLCLPQNWQGNTSVNAATENEIVSYAFRDAEAIPERVYKPENRVFVGDVDLHFDADKMLFSSIGTHNRWQIFEVGTDGAGLRQVSLGEDPDIDHYDPVYLPDGRIIYDSTANFQGVPCVGGGDYVANLHIMNADGTGDRRLCFDQDNDWCPTMLPNGRVLYLRWEYTDSAHYFSRVLMHMNPDGTNQTEYYGSNSYWPNSLFYARPVPGSNTRFVGIVSGHHGVPRMGELVLFDIARDRKEGGGAVQRVPGWGKPVDAPIIDGLVDGSWPKFLHPYPLSDKYFLVSMKRDGGSPWGLYLADAFDNLLLLREEPGMALFEPLPLKSTPKPPVIPDRIDMKKDTATVYLQDVYAGPGLAEVPRGAVKTLRVFQYEYSYRNMGGHYNIGMEGPWDVRRIIGTVPVHEDGSALFTIPANTPVAVQPMDASGQALQQMRSWFVGMPGENVSCVGCHEKQNSVAFSRRTAAAERVPSPPKPWYGEKRGFSFLREVQPVLDRFCAGCHDGSKKGRPNLADASIIPTSAHMTQMPRSYIDLHPYVRRNGPEGDYRLLTPLEFHADTSWLVQMLRKGHYNVELDDEAWDRLITWIDLNVPCHGTWHESTGRRDGIPGNFEARRYELKKEQACVDEDIEAIPEVSAERPEFLRPPRMGAKPEPVRLAGWPWGPEKAAREQAALGNADTTLDLGDGVTMALRSVPAGEFVMGDVNGYGDEFPQAAVRIDKAFRMGVTEVSLLQYRRFDPTHSNGYYDMHYKDQVKPGYNMDANADAPAIRVSFVRAQEFCRWLSARTGKTVELPTEAEWEWACRAGTDGPFYYGDADTDFAPYANLADVQIRKLAVIGVNPQPVADPDAFWDFELKDARFDDGTLHLAAVGSYAANAWGLKDMIGNVAEWTASAYAPYPYTPSAADLGGDARRVVRGGSWHERPQQARASFRLAYPEWQRVYNVGFRVVVRD